MHGQSALSDLMVKNLRVAKAFRENNDRINNIDFSENGETLISSSDDDSIVIYDCQNGTFVILYYKCIYYKNIIHF